MGKETAQDIGRQSAGREFFSQPTPVRAITTSQERQKPSLTHGYEPLPPKQFKGIYDFDENAWKKWMRSVGRHNYTQRGRLRRGAMIYDVPEHTEPTTKAPPSDLVTEQSSIDSMWTRRNDPIAENRMVFAPGIHPKGEKTLADMEDFVMYPGLRQHLEVSGVTRAQYKKAMDPSDKESQYAKLVQKVEEDPILADAINAGEGKTREIMLRLLVVLGLHQGYAVTHSELISKGMTDDMLQFMGVPKEQWAYVRQGALLHDIGKMVVPTKDILDTPGYHKHNQYEVAKRELHGIVGVEIAEEIGADEAIPFIRGVHQLKPIDVQYNPPPDAVRRFKKRAKRRGESPIFPAGRYGRRSDGKTKPNGAEEVFLVSYPDDEQFMIKDDKAEDGINPLAAGKILVGTYDTISALTDPLRAYLTDSTGKIGTRLTPMEVRDMVVRDFGHNFRQLAKLRGLNEKQAEGFCVRAINLMLSTAVSHHNQRLEDLARRNREAERMAERSFQSHGESVFERKLHERTVSA